MYIYTKFLSHFSMDFPSNFPFLRFKLATPDVGNEQFCSGAIFIPASDINADFHLSIFGLAKLCAQSCTISSVADGRSCS